MGSDPDIQARWDEARDAFRRILRPYLQHHVADARAQEITDWLNETGWKVPLRRVDPVIAAARAARDHAARQDPK